MQKGALSICETGKDSSTSQLLVRDLLPFFPCFSPTHSCLQAARDVEASKAEIVRHRVVRHEDEAGYEDAKR